MIVKDDLVEKYRKRLEQEFSNQSKKSIAFSSNYLDFKKELLPAHLTAYENLCNISESIIKISPDKKSSSDIQEQIDMCHLSISPTGVFSFAVLSFILVFVSLSLVGFAVFRSVFFVFYSMLVAAVVLAALLKLPEFFGNNWRLRASNQMVQTIFYVATYMRHTSNLELAIMFASDHLVPPLSLDLKKVLWDVETEKYASIKESLDNYLERWKKWNPEFIESFHLIEGSLMETSEERRLGIIDKALNVMLEETYEKMLRYAHELKGPITMLYMLGIILPILGLVIIPLVASFMTKDPATLAMYLALLYNVTLPLGVYYLSKMVLAHRPTGYGETDISENNPELRKYRNAVLKFGKTEVFVSPFLIAICVFSVLLFLGLTPILLKLVLSDDILTSESVIGWLLGYQESRVGDGLVGPYGLGAAIFSFLVPLAFGLSLGIYFKIRSSKVIEFRENTKKLEDEFASALFQLGNRLGDGLPAETAFSKVAKTTEGTPSGEFFSLVSMNIRKRGMGLKQSIFDPLKGALVYFPSSVIESAMKVLVESSKKGPIIASQALINISEYIKQIHRVNERLKDLMAEIISDMKQQTHVLAPAIAGIVVGISSMVVSIMGSLNEKFGDVGGVTGMSNNSLKAIMEMFGEQIPTYYLQIIIGLYIVEIVYILTVLTNGIENGADHLSEEYNVGKNLIRSTILYTVIALIVVIMFNIIASSLLQGFSNIKPV